MVKYILKRILLLLLTVFVITTICFVLIKLLDVNYEGMSGTQIEIEMARREALGYGKPILVQYGIYLKNIFTNWDWGTSWKISYLKPVTEVLSSRLLPTLLVNLYSLILSVPIGIGLGIFAALKKNKWQDHVISTLVMLFISVPSYIYAFLVQYIFYFKLNWLPGIVSSLYDAGGSWFSPAMFKSMLLPIFALSFGVIAGLARFTRAELTEVLTNEFMLLARTKGLTRSQAVVRHALRNAMVPILPMIIGEFISILSGSLIIEKIFVIPGVGGLYLDAINHLDYDVFMYTGMFYTVIGLAASILIDISYGFIDPRIRMGEK